jgi:hypothetical protein
MPILISLSLGRGENLERRLESIFSEQQGVDRQHGERIVDAAATWASAVWLTPSPGGGP